MQSRKSGSMLAVARELLEQGGVARLYRGTWFNLLRAVPGPAAGFAVTVPVVQALDAALNADQSGRGDTP